MPWLLWPSIGQYKSYEPSLESVARSVALAPGWMSPVFSSTPFPSISSAWAIVPLFDTLKS